jgi:mannose-6-phosphate isomerase-like protein (cupin superfamily)
MKCGGVNKTFSVPVGVRIVLAMFVSTWQWKFPLPARTVGLSCAQPLRKENFMLSHKKIALFLFAALAIAGLAALAQSAKKSAMTSTALEWNSIETKPNANGSGKKFFEGPTATLDLLECHASTLNPGATNHAILTRPHDEVIIVKEGTIEAYVTDKWVRIGPGSVIFNAANVPQAMRNVGDGPATYHVVMFQSAAEKQK